MKLSVKGLALAGGILWGVLGILGVGVVNLVWPGSGKAFLDLAASIYPGYHAIASFGQVIVGGLYGFVDGAAGGALLAWLYNFFAGAKA